MAQQLTRSFDDIGTSIVKTLKKKKKNKKNKETDTDNTTEVWEVVPSASDIDQIASSSRSNLQPGNGSNSNQNLEVELDADDMASAYSNLVKFVGTIKDPNDPDKAALESYNVNRFLADVDAHIQSKKITEDADKIKIAHLYISSDKGDAKALVLSPAFENVDYEQFKELCRLTWQREEYQDPFFNLIKFKNLKLEGTPADFIARVYEYGKRLKEDIIANPQFPKHDQGNNKNLVAIQHVVDYFAYGLMYENFPEPFKNAFKESPTIDPTIGPLKMYSDIKTMVVKKQTRLENETVLYARGKEKRTTDNSNKNKAGGPIVSGQGTSKPKSSPTQSFQPQKQHSQGYGYQNQHFQSYQRGHGNYRGRGRGRGRGYSSYQTQYQQKVVCNKCKTPGHKADTCRSCHYCCKLGHWIADCPIKYRDENNGWNQGNTNNKDNTPSGQGQ